MTTLPEQFSAARKSQVEAQLNFLSTLTSKTFESAQKIIALNINTSRASVEKSSAAVRQLIATEDPRDLFAFTTRSQENFDTLLAYGRELFGIATTLQAGLIKPAIAAAVPAAAAPAAALPAAAPAQAALPAPVVTAAPAAAPAPVLASVPALLPPPAPKAAKPARKPAAAPEPASAPKPAAKAKPAARSIELAKPAAAPFPAASTQAKQMDMLAPKVDKKK